MNPNANVSACASSNLRGGTINAAAIIPIRIAPLLTRIVTPRPTSSPHSADASRLSLSSAYKNASTARTATANAGTSLITMVDRPRKCGEVANSSAASVALGRSNIHSVSRYNPAIATSAVSVVTAYSRPGWWLKIGYAAASISG